MCSKLNNWLLSIPILKQVALRMLERSLCAELESKKLDQSSVTKNRIGFKYTCMITKDRTQ